ncbi:MAG TPA: hypothetical protein VG845_02665 [Dehalococcoidia bacterium]|nr:hypothetical protein [Dehalococcoidia bacterium]
MQDTQTNRFYLISPYRWYTSRLAILLMGPFPIVTAVLVWFGPSTIEDHSASAARGFFSFFLAFQGLWLFAFVRGYKANRDPPRNYILLSPGAMTIAWSGQQKMLQRDEIDSFALYPATPGPLGLYRGLMWMPTNAFIALKLKNPVWFSFITLGGNWRTKAVPVETDDIDGLWRSLESWLSPD